MQVMESIYTTNETITSLRNHQFAAQMVGTLQRIKRDYIERQMIIFENSRDIFTSRIQDRDVIIERRTNNVMNAITVPLAIFVEFGTIPVILFRKSVIQLAHKITRRIRNNARNRSKTKMWIYADEEIKIRYETGITETNLYPEVTAEQCTRFKDIQYGEFCIYDKEECMVYRIVMRLLIMDENNTFLVPFIQACIYWPSFSIIKNYDKIIEAQRSKIKHVISCKNINDIRVFYKHEKMPKFLCMLKDIKEEIVDEISDREINGEPTWVKCMHIRNREIINRLENKNLTCYLLDIIGRSILVNENFYNYMIRLDIKNETTTDGIVRYIRDELEDLTACYSQNINRTEKTIEMWINDSSIWKTLAITFR